MSSSSGMEKSNLSTAALIGSVAACSFLLGRWSASAQEKDTDKSSSSARPTLPSQVASGQLLPEDQLRAFLRQLPSKPIGPRGQDPSEVHSTARIVILCASGKGGVGKSTVSVNLAYMLKQMGLEVGLLDLDIYGPSLPELVRLPPGCVGQNEAGRIIPIDYGGVALMSWGYVQPGQASTIRAPIANQMTTQLLTMVEWGPLDVLVIDSPPGTGDVLLSIAQTLTVDGAVLVTTSNSLSLADVAKGIQLFDKVEIPPLLVVRNMVSTACEACGHTQDLFADSGLKGLAEFLNERNVGLLDMPLDQLLSKAPPSFQPAMSYSYPYVRNPDNEARAAWSGFQRMAHAVLESLLGIEGTKAGDAVKVGRQKEAAASLRLRSGGCLEVRLKGGELHPIACGVLRANCRCAHCVDDLTGEIKIDQDKIRADKSLKAKELEPVGNYAIRVTWSDGHTTLVATKALATMVGTQSEQKLNSAAPSKSSW
eukprot:TRINITY_DN41130_c0_g1_i1.p1 TRINITY_DN41130_c0_g1~~TRINITY_DN41130_c0_g1_i1.p1  ORF type:complete len:489 (+),score=84.28 TRINITY_DN41130_c0_g1_i1:27-1469(+)